MNHLLRDLAPISEQGWDAIETEAKARLTTHLAARRMVDFTVDRSRALTADASGPMARSLSRIAHER